MRLLLQHTSRYEYPRPAALGPHLLRLKPASHVQATIETYALHVSDGADLRWQQDPYGNHLARATFRADRRVDVFEVRVELAVDVRPVNPFDFFVDDDCQKAPITYATALHHELAPFLDLDGDPAFARGKRFESLLESLPREGATVPMVIEVNRRVNEVTRYVIREEAGVWTPEETLTEGRGSCRDSAVLLIAALRSRGFAARFVSGYLVQLIDEGMLPDSPKGIGRDVVDLHAWAEVYLPGAGWIGLDATSGLLCGEGHIALACTSTPALASPIEGSSDVPAKQALFSTTIARLGHEPRPTAPYEEAVWQHLVEAGDAIDRKLEAAGCRVTLGGEPTFNARENVEAPEWNSGALGHDKWRKGVRLVEELRKRLVPGAAVLLGQGKHYPGESLPRWTLDLCARRDGVPVWTGALAIAGETSGIVDDGVEQARTLTGAIARELHVEGFAQPAYEDPWRFLQEEASLPIDVDPLDADLGDSEARKRLARVLDRGLGRPAGFVLPLAKADGGSMRGWKSERWTFRRGHLFVMSGDSPIGLRLPLQSLPKAVAPPPAVEAWSVDGPRDPRRAPDGVAQPSIATSVHPPPPSAVRTALCVEARRAGDALALHVFLPPQQTAEGFFELVSAIDRARISTGISAVILEGYGPPKSPNVYKFSVTPDPGVLEVNLPPAATLAQYRALIDHVFDAALHSGLHSEKYLLDGRMAGSGGGHHLTLGGETPAESVFLKRPDVLASLLTLVQHHPSLSYLFTGLFVGPTSQAPRVDEARLDSLYELEIALDRAFQTRREPGVPPPWLSDILFRHLLVDLAGNTHRTELCIDKLCDPQTAYGRQGLIELRAFEMPPHPRMAVAQMTLVRALVASVIETPYQAPLVRWGQTLHDRFLLPHWMWRDFEDLLEELARRGVTLSADAYRPFLELRCPIVGALQAGDVRIEIRNAIEPWNVLGEEVTAGGTSRYVDSSMERIEVRVEGLIESRHAVLVNGHVLPMKRTQRRDEHVGGVRFRAWAPPHALHPHIGIHHPVQIDVVDRWSRRSLGACAYHVWHPEGRGYASPPLTRFEAAARRAQRFTVEGHLASPVHAVPTDPSDDSPYTLDLRRYPIDRPPPAVATATASEG